MKYLLFCSLLLSSHYYLQLNQNADVSSPCCSLVFAQLSTSQGSTPTMQYMQPCQYLIWMLTGQHPSPCQPANQPPEQLNSQMELYFLHFEVIRQFLCQCGLCNTVCLSIKHSYTHSVILNMHYVGYSQRSCICCILRGCGVRHHVHNLGCGSLMLLPETNSLNEGSHPSAAGPQNSCLTRQ